MLLLEHEGKSVLRDYGIPTPNGVVVRAGDDIAAAARGLTGPYMVKAQILAGGRGKAGAITAAATPEDAARAAKRLLGSTIKEHRVDAVLLEEQVKLKHERYLSFLFDSAQMLCLIGARGGVEVESYFGGDQHGFQTIEVDPTYGLGSYQVRVALERLGIPADVWSGYSTIATRLADLFRRCDATLAEINPLAELADGSLMALDARIVVDDGAFFRQPRFAAIDKARLGGDGVQARMRELEIQYIPVGGSVGLVSSGAGCGVTIMDWVAREGGQIAAFVDLDYAIMSGRTNAGLKLVFETMLQDPKVRSVVVNFTTCGLRLDHLAQSLLEVLGELKSSPRKPIFFHLQGNRAPLAHKAMREAGYEICEALGDAVRKAVHVAGGVAA